MKIALDIGHNCVHDYGSRAIGNEDEMAMDTGKKVKSGLSEAGFEVLLVTPNRAQSTFHSLQQRVYKANSWSADFYLSIHFNAGGGSGSEVWTGSTAGRTAALNILTKLEELGYKNRGAKQQGVEGKGLYVLKYTKMPAILVEGCFTDSREDMNLYDAEKMADVICKGMEITFMEKAINKDFQKKLNLLGLKDFEGKPLVDDGIFGECTKEAVMNFQKTMALDMDGVLGPSTRFALEQIISRPLCSMYSKYLYAVRYIQFKIGMHINGIFGADTFQAVLNFQKSAGIEADGIVGKVTWAHIIN